VHRAVVRHGQRHEIELAAARRVASVNGVAEHIVYPLDLRLFGASALTADISVPKDAVGAPGIPITYVPARNTIFLAIALGLAEARGAGRSGSVSMPSITAAIPTAARSSSRHFSR
jgi:7-cyano-7-deazaguanine synthase